jgi:hypothetical protein
VIFFVRTISELSLNGQKRARMSVNMALHIIALIETVCEKLHTDIIALIQTVCEKLHTDNKAVVDAGTRS